MPAKQNFLLQSEDLTSVSWVKQAGVVVTPDVAIAPNGTLTADLIDFTAAAAPQGMYQGTVYTGILNVPVTLTRSIWLKGVVGGEVVTIGDSAYSSPVTQYTLTTDWQRYDNVTPIDGHLLNCGLWIHKVSGNQFYAWGAQIALANWATDYVSTTTAAINTGKPRDIVPKQNLVTSSEVANNWAKANATVGEDALVAPDGTLTMDTVIDDSVNAGHYISLNSPNILTPGVYTFSTFIKPVAGCSFVVVASGTVADGCGIVVDGATMQYLSTTTTGSNFPLLGYEIKPTSNGTYRVSITFSHLKTQLTCLVGVNKAKTNTWGWGYVGVGDSVGTWGRQLVRANWAGDYQPTTTTVVDNPIRNAVLKQNLLRSSDVSSVYTTKVGTPTITGGQLAPDGTLTAFSVSSANATTYLQQQVAKTLTTGRNYTASVWMKADAPCACDIEFVDVGDGVPTYYIRPTLTTSWTKYEVKVPNLDATANVAGMGMILGSRFGLWPTARTISIWHPQIVEANWAGDDCPTTGTIIDNPIRNVVLKQNLIIYSNQMENWTKTAGCTRTAVVEDGRTCSRLDFATIGDYIYRNSTTPIEVGPSGTRLIPSFWIKKISSSGTISMFNPISFSYGRFIIDLALLPSGWVKIDYAKPAPWMTVTHTYGVYLTRNDGMAFQPVDIGLSVFVADNQIVANANHGGEYQPTGATAIFNPIRDIVLKQNLLVKSSDFASADWTKRGTCVVTPDQAISPLTGLMTASLITGMAGVGHDMYNTNYATTIAPPANSVVTPSLYIKRISTVGSLQIQNPTSSNLGWWRIDFAALQDNVWYRVGKDTPGFTEVFPFLSAPAVGVLLNSTASGFSFYLDGAQVVKANWAGDYQPTTGTAVANPIRLSA